MVRRIAATLSLVAFALCIVMGIMAENPFVTTLSRGLKAMLVTFFVGLIVGGMAQRMLDENLAAAKKKLEIEQTKSPPQDR